MIENTKERRERKVPISLEYWEAHDIPRCKLVRKERGVLVVTGGVALELEHLLLLLLGMLCSLKFAGRSRAQFTR